MSVFPWKVRDHINEFSSLMGISRFLPGRRSRILLLRLLVRLVLFQNPIGSFRQVPGHRNRRSWGQGVEKMTEQESLMIDPGQRHSLAFLVHCCKHRKTLMCVASNKFCLAATPPLTTFYRICCRRFHRII